ncbi:unnamed protein product [Rotaria socialis]|uniref:Transmembrane protein n=1 Tax=Rotaria socialis TaxID=392032 RepID=A0A820N4M2_9BILA|nr:unnamed protein product [Rotaria socialis]
MAPRKSEKPIQTAPKRSSDSHFNQMSRLNSWNGNSVYPSNSQPNTSVIGQPRFNCNTVLGKVTSSKMVLFLVGFILCGIPLAVFVTLCVCLNMGPNAFFNLLLSNLCLIALASYVFFSVTLPMECYSYTTLTESYRSYLTFSGCCSTPYDSVSYIPSGWYRISGAAGTQLLTTPVSSIDICGAPYGGYFNGTLPTTAGASVTGTFCFYTGSPCSFSVAPITAINCNGYYVFYLISLSVGLKYRYCSTS